MAKKKNSLTNIINMVSVRLNGYTEVYVATAEGSYGKFVVRENSTNIAARRLEFEELTPSQYHWETQHALGSSKTSTYGSRNPEEK